MAASAGFQPFAAAVEVHLVEVSPVMRTLQWDRLACGPVTEDREMPSTGQQGSTQSMHKEKGSTEGTQHAGTSTDTTPEQGVTSLNGAQVGEWESPLRGRGCATSTGVTCVPCKLLEMTCLFGAWFIQQLGRLASHFLRGLGCTHPQVTWHPTLQCVPDDQPAIYLAHEFFDALPVHQFVKDSRWGLEC